MRAAVAVVLVAGLAAVLVAPRLDIGQPLLDPEAHRAVASRPSAGCTFSWNHSYGALGWPRTGRELLRIRAEHPSYWKVENLARFDGLRWVQPRELGPTAQEANIRAGRPEWLSEVHVRVRGLISRMFVGAGTTIRVSESPRIPIRNAPGTFRTGPRPLRAGHSYDATVWTPRPSRRQLRSARASVPHWTWPYLRMDLPAAQGGPVLRPARSSVLRTPQTAQVSFPALRERSRQPAGDRARGASGSRRSRPPASCGARTTARSTASRSGCGRGPRRPTSTSAASSSTSRRASGTRSDPPPRRGARSPPFLTEDKAGYCQQYSGAMALLLRMGGVPARVSTGFSPGTLDRESGEYVVRDTDAHSWVEAYLAPYGWVTFDPTPPIGPARLTAVAGDAASPYQLAAPEGALGAGDRVVDPGFGPAATADGGSRCRWIAAGVAVLAAFGVALALLAAPAPRRTRPSTPRSPSCTPRWPARAARRPTSPSPRWRTATAAPRRSRTCARCRPRASAARTSCRRRRCVPRCAGSSVLGLGPAARLGAWRAIPPVAPPQPPRSLLP